MTSTDETDMRRVARIARTWALCAVSFGFAAGCPQAPARDEPARAEAPSAPAARQVAAQAPVPPSVPPAFTPPTIATQGGACRVERESPLAENDQPARGIAVAYANGHGIAAWPLSPARVAVQRLTPEGVPEGPVRELDIELARGIHALLPLGNRFVLMTRGACPHPPDPGHLHCSAYVGLDASLAPTGPQILASHLNQAHLSASTVVGDALYLAVVMESWIDQAGLSAPTFDTHLARLAFDASGALVRTVTEVDAPLLEESDPAYAVVAPCADGRTACGVFCCEWSNQCTRVGIAGRDFRAPTTGGKPTSIVCAADGCDVLFRKGGVVRATHVRVGGTERFEPPAMPRDAALAPGVEAGQFVRRDPAGGAVGAPLAVGSRDARASATWTGTRFLAATTARRSGVTRYSIATIVCEPAP